ncbi:protein U52 [Proboscivirus elephantidbeta4]|uniref:Protein U52 n=1 Tax=Elephant endotheliotropic herpesvirus 4 TaxID=548914 RepID=A0A0S1TKQ7_9BETA|nr:protein U52 [Elephant endotheliotropic herpesvirus 4]ALM26003.1 protein U52 [Elephant endotheliotropic herpesvirus 4]
MSRAGAHLSVNDDSKHLIMQITEKLLKTHSLGALKFEELKIVHMGCQIAFMRGILTLLVRECHWNAGNDDIRILNRNVPATFWVEIHEILRRFVKCDEAWIFSDVYAENTFKFMRKHNVCVRVYENYMLSKLGLYVPLPDFLHFDANLLFYLGTVAQHRLYKTFSIFQRYWGVSEFEPIIRIIVRKTWFFFLILWSQLRVDANTFCEQDPKHEIGILSFLQSDYMTFTGLVDTPIKLDRNAFEELFREIDINVLIPE